MRTAAKDWAANMEIIRKHIVFYSWVQGVGFRYRARYAAQLAGATGWVRNEYDGSVTMEIQGTEEQIDQVILSIERGTYVRIENMDCRTVPVLPQERGFRTDDA
jgi:acylphosphatase